MLAAVSLPSPTPPGHLLLCLVPDVITAVQHFRQEGFFTCLPHPWAVLCPQVM